MAKKRIQDVVAAMATQTITYVEFSEQYGGQLTITYGNGHRLRISAEGDDAAHLVLTHGTYHEEELI